MALIENDTKDSHAVDVLRLEILMQHYPKLGCSLAALRWTDPLGGGAVIRPHLVALYYGYILRTHYETRAELFGRVGELARENVQSKGAASFEFAPWLRDAGVGKERWRLWPWQIVTPQQLVAPTIYSVVLKLGKPSSAAPTGRWIEVALATGQEQVLLPSSALIAIAGLAKECEPVTRYLLARLLRQMNLFWGSPNMVTLFSEAAAYAAAVSTIRGGTFRIP